MKKLCIGIICGGKSPEHEISLKSAENIIAEIEKNRFNIVVLKIDKQGKWHLINNRVIDCKKKSFFDDFAVKRSKDILIFKYLSLIDVAFPIVHGILGEDGSLQGMLHIANLPFIGSNVQSSAICMDKDISKRILRDAGFHIAPFVTLSKTCYKNYTFSDLSFQLGGTPLFVKPSNQGSSIGINQVFNEEQFIKAVKIALKFSNKVIVELGIQGREIECGILGNEEPQASKCGEIIYQEGNFYTYRTKYINSARVQLIVPAILNSYISDKIRSISIDVYKILGCSGMARVDVFLTKKNEVIINEINTLPGFTNVSMFPKLWQASNIKCSDLITRLIELALENNTFYR